MKINRRDETEGIVWTQGDPGGDPQNDLQAGDIRTQNIAGSEDIAVYNDEGDFVSAFDYGNLRNKPNFYSWVIEGEKHPVSPSVANAVHSGFINLAKDVQGHDLFDRTHQEIMGQNFMMSLIFGRAA